MTLPRTAPRLFAAAVIGLASIAACAAAAPATGEAAQAAWTPDPAGPGAPPPDEAASKAKAPADAGPSDDAGPRCPYGELSDPHRGFVRCLLPEERDAGWLPPPSQGEPPAQPPPKEAPRSGPPPVVEIGAAKFESGDVPKADKALGKLAGDIAQCVAEHGGLTGDAGTLKVTFLVRARGRAEGVEVSGAKGVTAEATACVRVLLKNKAIGAPTADPVGVSVVVTLKAPK
jgi:hypothetical protein